jgi:uncharacterized protein (TIGR03435 family)
MEKSVDDGFFQPRVVDKTGLTGKYTFILEFNCPACVPLSPTVSVNPDGLGLKLIKTTDVPMEVIVVEALN